ncbi:hypothetical protein ASPBRDRAFT_624309 [Aspergillus brasiliensis CBS 101740]|uniref:Secreted protein n=1 Tax=Aspergillus brasiliensis (strain CBS 101740 / IMI 381727 / IBT 21946) TaxID=767769 RepID=A0A1L9UFV0_ASPBC|nr:hypothetical protein ASPBRDRAFT_624309 [Aspergillus brasiliensis CBS 101740]
MAQPTIRARCFHAMIVPALVCMAMLHFRDSADPMRGDEWPSIKGRRCISPSSRLAGAELMQNVNRSLKQLSSVSKALPGLWALRRPGRGVI